MKTLTVILNYIDVGAPLVTLFFFIKPFKELSRELLYIFVFVCMQFLSNLAASVLASLVIANYSVYAVNIILSFVLLSLMFYNLISKTMNRFILLAATAFTVIAILSIVNGEGINTYNSVVSAVASFIITAYCLIYFYWKLVSDGRMIGLTASSLFWVIIGIFTYYTGSFFIFISYKYLIVQEASVIGILWRFHNVLLTIFCFYTIYGLTCRKYQRT